MEKIRNRYSHSHRNEFNRDLEGILNRTIDTVNDLIDECALLREEVKHLKNTKIEKDEEDLSETEERPWCDWCGKTLGVLCIKQKDYVFCCEECAEKHKLEFGRRVE